jgi:hypothetical protein
MTFSNNQILEKYMTCKCFHKKYKNKQKISIFIEQLSFNKIIVEKNHNRNEKLILSSIH